MLLLLVEVILLTLVLLLLFLLVLLLVLLLILLHQPVSLWQCWLRLVVGRRLLLLLLRCTSTVAGATAPFHWTLRLVRLLITAPPAPAAEVLFQAVLATVPRHAPVPVIGAALHTLFGRSLRQFNILQRERPPAIPTVATCSLLFFRCY